MREAWCAKRDACSPKSLKIERATPHARHAWCVFVLGSRIHRSGSGQHASREPTMTSFYGFSRVPTKILAWDPATTTCWPIRRLHSLLILFVLHATQCDWWYVSGEVCQSGWGIPSTIWHFIKGIYKDSIRNGNIWDNIAEAIDVKTFIFR